MTTALEIVQIVPRLPPSISGVGDYAYLLARELRATHDIHTHFIVCDPFWEGAENVEQLIQRWGAVALALLLSLNGAFECRQRLFSNTLATAIRSVAARFGW